MKSLALKILFLVVLLLSPRLDAQSNVNVRVMAANLNGNTQSYQPFALRIFQGLKPDVVAIQEFNYTSTNGLNVNNAAAFREMLDTAFGTNYVYYREPASGNGDIPNGIISRYPIIYATNWVDTQVANRSFAWAQIDVPGTNDIYVVSVHFLTSSSTARATEANNLKALMQANFPANAWIVLAGDFNAGSRTEACVTTFNGYLTDFPVPVDNLGNSDTSANRNSPHDYMLPSLTFTNVETPTVLPSHSFPNGLVFDSAVYTPLSDVPPVQSGDSGQAQHMAVMKDFSISFGPATNPPAIVTQPQGQTNTVGATISFSVSATGGGTLNYQWLFSDTNISGATVNPLVLANAQLTNNGNYSVVITNLFGSVTSSTAILLVTNAPPAITTQPQQQVALAGQSVAFSVSANGTTPLNYQWLFNGTIISGATTNPLLIPGAQQADAGNYSVVITNIVGSVTSSAALLTIVFTNPVVFAQWNFNSTTPDGSTSSGTTAPSTGSGTASLVGGTTSTFATGNTNLDPAFTNDNSAWNTTSYPASGNNRTAGAQFSVSTAGKQNIAVGWSQQSSKTGGKYFRMQYSTNSGTTFDNVATACTLPLGTNFYTFTNSLVSATGVNNNSNFVFRIVGEFESTATNGPVSGSYAAAQPGSTYSGSTGTTRFDMVSVSGTSYIVATNAALTPAAFTSGQFNFNIAGSTGASYVIQTSTNLSSTNWISIYTNVSPFNFSDTNPTDPQRFYRAVSGQ